MAVGILLIFAWYRLDSDQRGFRRSPGLNIGIIAVAIVGLPYYLFRSRGAKRGFMATCAVLAIYAVSVALYVGGIYIAYFGLQA